MLSEVIQALRIQSGKWYLDATFGRGGHSQEILKLGGSVLGFDHDGSAIEYAHREFAEQIRDGKLQLFRENMEKVREVLSSFEKPIVGVLIDAGVSSPQLDDSSRGFAFMHEAPLDMRMDKRLAVTAKDLVNALGKKELESLLQKFAQETKARVIAEAIVRRRKERAIETTTDLADIIQRAVGKFGTPGKLHPATKTFMALRIAVNDELGSLERAMPQFMDLLAIDGRIVTIGFHEGEDRIFKTQFNEWEKQGLGEHLTHSVLLPQSEEILQNPRSRSAKLRIFEKQPQKEQA